MNKIKLNPNQKKDYSLWGKALEISKKKYEDCDEGKKHKFPYNFLQNTFLAKYIICLHCSHHLQYESKIVKKILEQRKKDNIHPMDAPLLQEEERNDINAQKTSDFNEAVRKELKKLKGLSLLEKLV